MTIFRIMQCGDDGMTETPREQPVPEATLHPFWVKRRFTATTEHRQHYRYKKDSAGTLILDDNGNPRREFWVEVVVTQPPPDWYTTGRNHHAHLSNSPQLHTREIEQQGWGVTFDKLDDLLAFIACYDAELRQDEDSEPPWLLVLD